MGDITGTTFAGHEVRDVVGIDLVSTLYRAVLPDEDHAVSLRVIAQDLCVVDGTDRQLYRRFRSQATASLTFEHPHSPTVEEVGEQHGQGYLIAPFIDSVPLSRLVGDHPPLAVDVALDLFEQIADVLDSGQGSGLTHGAVNPSTVAFARPGDDGRPEAAYLIGYGVGALLELRLKRDRKELTVVDDLLYVAPEQLRQQPVTGRTDQYALACALVHVLTGQPPFVRDSIGGLFGAHLFVEPELKASLTWAEPVRKAMAKEPDERFDTCGDLIAAIRSEKATGVAWAPDPPAAAVVPPPNVAARAPVADTAARPAEQPQPVENEPQVAERRSQPSTPPPAQPSRARPQPVTVEADADADRVGGTAVFTTSSAAESRNGVQPPQYDSDTPLLSEVLSQHSARRRGRPSSPGAKLLLLLLGLVIMTAIVVWVIGS